MGILLVTAFLAINIYSLLLMLCIAFGMALVGRARRRVWRLLVLPLLGLILIWQYAVLVGWPPFLKPQPGGRSAVHLELSLPFVSHMPSIFDPAFLTMDM